MNLFADIRELVVAELQALMAGGVLPQGLDLTGVAVERADTSRADTSRAAASLADARCVCDSWSVGVGDRCADPRSVGDGCVCRPRCVCNGAEPRAPLGQYPDDARLLRRGERDARPHPARAANTASTARPARTARTANAGLGLAVAQDLIGRHDGLIEFDSRPGRTVFTLLLPFEKHEPGETA